MQSFIKHFVQLVYGLHQLKIHEAPLMEPSNKLRVNAPQRFIGPS